MHSYIQRTQYDPISRLVDHALDLCFQLVHRLDDAEKKWGSYTYLHRLIKRFGFKIG